MIVEAVSNRVVSSPSHRSLCSMIVPVSLFHEDNPSRKIVTYALLDSQSDSCFVREDLVQNIGAPAVNVKLNLTMMGNRTCVDSRLVRGLSVKGLTELDILSLPSCYTRGEIPCSPGCIPVPDKVARWPHLAEVADALVPARESWGVGLLIGYNCARALLPQEVVTGVGEDAPYGVRTPLSWSVVGRIEENENNTNDVYCYKISATKVTVDKVRAAFDVDFEDKDRCDEKKSQEDIEFLKIMKQGVKQLDNGHIELPLPLRDAAAAIPNSKMMAERRLASLRNKLLRNKDFREKYVTFIRKMKINGYVEIVPSSELDAPRKWYLPHQGVQHPRKPDVVRVVHDRSAECQGISLNSLLIQGPDQNNLLVGVLLRFRLSRYCVTCDIEGMFLQVMVTKEHRDMLHFLWFTDDDPRKPVVELRVCVHLFGAASSPACAMYALREVARRYKDDFPPEVTQFLTRYFYVDDGIKAVSTPEEAWVLIKGSKELCSRGGFNLHKYMSNHLQIMEKIPEDWRAKDMTPEKLTDPEAPWYSLLGTNWSLFDDKFRFSVKMPESCDTKREMLSFLGSIYDPTGFISPVVLTGRMILQSLCKTGTSWDKKADEVHQKEWNTWMESLKSLDLIKVPRCIVEDTRKMEKATLHIFSDASSTGYGVCCYLETSEKNAEKKFDLVYAKARVNPVKPVTIPRMELQAAVLATAAKDTVVRELDHLMVKCQFYTDSKVVMGYIQNSKKKCRLYVANRVQTIRERSKVSEWHYVNTKRNPADLASRGTSPAELAESTLWWTGPKEVMTDHQKATFYEISEDDPGLKRETKVLNTLVHDHYYLEELEHISTWSKIVSTVAVWRRFLYCARATVKKETKPFYGKHVSSNEREEASQVIVRGIQQGVFPHEYQKLSGGVYPVSRSECASREELLGDDRRLRKLDPYADECGTIRVGGRVRRANLPMGWKHPAILPSRHPIVQAIIWYYHCLIGHGSKYDTITELRNAGFWVLRWRKSVDEVIRKCVICKKAKALPQTQKMADLPRDRLEIAPPFTFVGVDMFGPFVVKDGRSVKKCWACLFTCLVMRAIHVEVCEDMSTSSFINAYRRLVARRGPVKSIRNDRGTNILGARAELSRGMASLDRDVIALKLAKHGCDYVEFLPNPPHAPHMGGVWERMVRLVKHCLGIILSQLGEQLSSETLHTFLLEAESIVNNRPLFATDNTDPEAPQPLSPAQLLTLKPRGALPPPGNFTKEDMYCRQQWKRTQYTANEFWQRWKKEYIPLLQTRAKWEQPSTNVEVGDVVMIKNLQTPRSTWPIGRVLEAQASEDGLVRSVKLQTGSGLLVRPIHLLIILLKADVEERDNASSEPDDNPQQ